MVDKLIEILESCGYPVYRQGSFSEDEPYPDHFFTYWNNETPDHYHYDDSEFGTEWDFDVNFYSIDPEKTYSVLLEAREKLKKSRWVVPSKGGDIRSDEPTHTGRGMQAFYLEIN